MKYLICLLIVTATFIPTRKSEAEELVNYEQILKEEQRIQDEVSKQILEIELLKKAQEAQGKRGGWCVTFVKDFTGTPRRTKWTRDGYARTISVDTKEPIVGSLILTSESNMGHVGLVLPKPPLGKVRFVDSNYVQNTVTIRELDINSPKIRGYNTTLAQNTIIR